MRDSRNYELVAPAACLPVRSGHPEITRDVLPGVSALLMSHKHVTGTIYATDTADDGRIIVSPAISVQLHPLHARTSTSPSRHERSNGRRERLMPETVL